MSARLFMRGNRYYSPCAQCLGVSGTLQHLLLLRGWAMILPLSHSPFLHWSIVCSSLPSLSWWAQTHLLSTSQTSWTQCGQNSPPEAGASSTGCRANCSALSWPQAAATTAPRREQGISFLNIKPSATFLTTLPTRRLIPVALSPGCWWKPLISFWYVTKQLQSVFKVRFSKASERAGFLPSQFVEKT